MPKEFPKVNFFNKNPTAAAISTKLLTGRSHLAQRPTGDLGNIGSVLHSLHGVSQSTTQSMNDVENIFEVLPDTELAMQILVSSILSPNDMRRPELNWSVDACELPAPLTGSLIEIIRAYFEDDYKIKAELPKWLEHALFYTGSFPIAIIPESSLDDLINERNLSTESFKAHLDSNLIVKSMGILGNPPSEKDKANKSSVSAGLESVLNAMPFDPSKYQSKSTVDSNIHITDHFGVLKMPQAIRRLTEAKVDQVVSDRLRGSLNLSIESLNANNADVKRMSLDDLSRTLYTNRNTSMQQVAVIKSADQATRATIGHPLTMKLPSDAVIPVHVPSDPETHVGYFVLLDEFGNPLSNAKQSSYYKEIASMRNMHTHGSASSSTLQQLKNLTKGLNCPDRSSYQDMAQIYASTVERDLMERLRAGVYGENVEIAHVDEVYQIMLSRSLASKRTQVLYIPARLLLYVAFDYNKLGVGRSLLDKSKTLASIRAILLFANTMASIKNSTNQRKVSIELDPEDPEPDRTIETLMTELAKTQSMAFPLATTHPMDIVNGIRNAATNIAIKGNPLMPEVSMDVEDRQGTRVMVDTELDDLMKNRHLMSLGLTPELVDSSTDIEFAAEIINRNLMFTKRLAAAQETTENFIVDFVKKFTINSGKLQYDLIKAVQEFMADANKPVEKITKDDGTAYPESMISDAKEQGLLRERNEDMVADMSVTEMIEHFLQCLEVKLPRPDDTKLDNQMEMMTTYASALDLVMPYYVNQEALEVLLGDDARDYVEPVIQMVRGYFMRDFIAKNNILPELQDLIAKSNVEEEPIDILESQIEHANGLAVVIKNLIDKLKKKNNPEGESTDDGSDGSGPFDDSSDSSGGDDPFADSGSDDLDFDMDDPAEEPEPETEEPVEEEEDTPEEDVPVEDTTDTDASEEEPKPE